MTDPVLKYPLKFASVNPQSKQKLIPKRLKSLVKESDKPLKSDDLVAAQASAELSKSENIQKPESVITIEGKNVEEELKKLKVIEAIPYVSSADMQMSYSEEELSNHMEVLENADLVPKVLNDKDIKVEDIVYRGDLKRKDLIGFAKEFDNSKK